MATNQETQAIFLKLDEKLSELKDITFALRLDIGELKQQVHAKHQIQDAKIETITSTRLVPLESQVASIQNKVSALERMAVDVAALQTNQDKEMVSLEKICDKLTEQDKTIEKLSVDIQDFRAFRAKFIALITTLAAFSGLLGSEGIKALYSLIGQ